MISETNLLQERLNKLSNLDEKYNAKICAIESEEKEKIDAKCMKFALSHDSQECELYRLALELGLKNKIAKKRSKYNHKLAKATIKSEVQAKELLRESKRVWELDFLRGIAIWGMIIDHYIWDFTCNAGGIFGNNFKGGWVSSMSDFADAYWTNDFRVFVRLFGVFLFVFLCGVSARFAKNNLKRGMGLFGFGLAITLAMAGIAYVSKDDSLQLLMSTISTIGLCLLIYTGISEGCKALFGSKNWKWICLGLFVAFSIFWGILSSINYLNNGHSAEQLFRRFFYVYNDNGSDIGWDGGFSKINADTWWKYVLGLKGFGSDWLGLFPYVGFIFLGGFVGETLYADKKSIIKYFYHPEDRELTGDAYFESAQGQLNAKLNVKLSGISYPGKHTLFVYVFHQPIFFAIMIPVFLLSGYQMPTLF